MLDPRVDLRNHFASAELTACLLTEQAMVRNAFSVLRFLPTSPPEQKFEFVTRGSKTIERTPFKLMITRSFLTMDQADAILMSKGSFTDPAVPSPTPVLLPGDWSGAELVGEDENHSARRSLPMILGAFWLSELWSDGALAGELDARALRQFSELVHQHLGIRVDRAERIGNLLAVWPERRMRTRVRGSRDGHSFRVEVRTQGAISRDDVVLVGKAMRNGQTLQALQATLDPVANWFYFGHDISEWQVEAYHRLTGDLLYRSGSLFLKEIVGNINLQTTHYSLVFNFTNPDGSIADTLKIDGDWGTTQKMRIGTRAPSARRQQALAAAMEQENLRAEGRVFFYVGGPEERARAVDDIRRLIKVSTESYLKIWDPYFGPRDIAEFATAVFEPDTKIRILTQLDVAPGETAAATALGMDQGSQAKSPREVKRGQIEAVVRKLRENGMANLRVRVGNNPSHDRFLITKDRGWQLGCSFNQIGRVISTIVEFPAPALIEAEFDSLWDRAGDASEVAP